MALVSASLWLGAGSANAYVIGGKPWPGGLIRYYNADPGMRSEVAAATKAWNSSGAHVHFIAVSQSRAQVLIVGWPKHARSDPEAGFGTLGWVPPGSRTLDPWGHLVRGSHVWLRPVDVANGLNSAEMTLAATHELGHVLGLGHSQRCATMDAEFVGLCKQAPHTWQIICRPLQPDDVAGAIALYGGRPHNLGPQRYCPYFPAPGPPTALTASVLGSGGYGPADSVRLSWRAPEGVRLNYSPTGNSVAYDEVFGALGHCATAMANQFAQDNEKPGAINRTIVQPSTPGRWCFTVRIFDGYQRAGGQATIWVNVPGPAPVASFDDTQDEFNGLLFHFQDQSTVSGGGVRYAWNFGDPASGATNTSAQANPSHPFSAPGSYQVKETVTDALGQTNSTTQTVDVVDYVAPTAAFDDNCSSDGNCSPAVSVYFNDDSSSQDGSIVAWSWNFGDPASGASNTDTTEGPAHDYSAPGQYTVTLTVTDEHGKQATSSQLVYIDP
jgi:PKD repeat protein